MTRFASICDGIGAAVIAFQGVGWTGAWRSEIDPFCESVAIVRYPSIPNLGDMTAITDEQIEQHGPIDVLVGGTPCQSFSTAGKRGGLSDERGNLTLEFVRLAKRTGAKHVVWENVPGVLSSEDGAFGCFLAGLVGCRERIGEGVDGWRWHDAGCVYGPEGAAAWRILDAQYFGLAQRRKRVFVVFCPRGGSDPRSILFEREGVRGDSPPSREQGSHVAGTLTDRLGTGGATDNDARQSHLIVNARQDPVTSAIAQPIDTDPYSQAVVFDPTQITSRHNRSNPRPGDPSHTLASAGHAPTLCRKGEVRRLTPRECERLQGFPDDWTLVAHSGKPASDTPRFRAIGNSMAVPVMAWIARRIENDKGEKA